MTEILNRKFTIWTGFMEEIGFELSPHGSKRL